MCGISGILYRNPQHYHRLGQDLLTLIQPLESRGPDSCGLALYRSETLPADSVTILLWGNRGVAWQDVTLWFDAFAPVLQTDVAANGQHLRLHIHDRAGLDLNQLQQQLRQAFPALSWVSAGQRLDVFKEVGAVGNLDKAYGLSQFRGSHGIGHTRMATESVVDADHCHPFTADRDLAIVHNGQISNYYRLRYRLEQLGVVFTTDNDSEILAHYIAYHRQQGQSLQATLQMLLNDIDGTYTFLVATIDQLALVRDRMAAKPAVVYETPDMVAIASEYRALLNLPDFRADATIWEPDAGDITLWSIATAAPVQRSMSLVH